MKLRRRRPPDAAPAADPPAGAEVTHAGDVEVWAVAGEIDVATRGRLEAVLAAVGRGDAPLVLDLGGVTFMDSTGLAVLLRIDAASREHGRRLAIVCPEGPARLVLAVSGVEDRLPLYATRAEALSAS